MWGVVGGLGDHFDTQQKSEDEHVITCKTKLVFVSRKLVLSFGLLGSKQILL